MNDRIQRALDGELPTDQLTPDELADFHRYHAAFCTAVGPIRGLPSIDVAPAVMQRVAGPGPVRRALRAVIDWVWAPRALSFSVRPAFAMAGALAIALLVWRAAPEAAPAPVASTPAETRVLVQFRLGATDAHEVALVGDFNGWKPDHRLHEVATGVWAVDVALEPGVYNYVFVIDGKTWRLDPLAPRVTDGFGGASSRVAVLAPVVRS